MRVSLSPSRTPIIDLSREKSNTNVRNVPAREGSSGLRFDRLNPQAADEASVS
jgi:hypothetical protein